MNSNGKLPNVVCIGGGTGTFVVLRGLKNHPVKLSAIVSMSDSGGSNKRIRDEFGLLPTSDIRQCLVALSDENHGAGLLRKLFMYRFEKGEGISGMTFGNLFMAALTDILGSQQLAFRETGKVLRIHGTVIPVTLTKTNLTATYEDGSVSSEEHIIDEPIHDGSLKITSLSLEPQAPANEEALSAIRKADCIVLGPGDLFTSVLPNILVDGVKEAIGQAKSHAKIVYVMNLMTKYGQTLSFTASDHLKQLEKYLGPCITHVLINTTKLPELALSVYKKSGEFIVKDDLDDSSRYTTIREDMAGDEIIQKSSSDVLNRSLIRHDSDKVANVILSILTSGKSA